MIIRKLASLALCLLLVLSLTGCSQKNISYNEEGTPGLGSAIFLHCYGPAKPFTGGCVAIPEDCMKFVMQRVDEETAVVINTYEVLSDGADWPSSTWPQER